jgi:hypothetical protein
LDVAGSAIQVDGHRPREGSVMPLGALGDADVDRIGHVLNDDAAVCTSPSSSARTSSSLLALQTRAMACSTTPKR